MQPEEHAAISCKCPELDRWMAAVEVATNFAGILSFSEFFDAVASYLAGMMEAGGAALIVRDGEEHLRYKLFHGLDAVTQQSVATFRFHASSGTVGRALMLGTPLYTEDYPHCADAMPEFVNAGVEANLVVPLGGPSGFVGAMVISWLNRRPKPLDASSLMIVGMFAALVSSALHREALEDQLRKQSLHDALTGLPNRRLMMLRLVEAYERAQRQQTLIAVGVIDLDGFKQVNDRFGHQEGDQILVTTSSCIRQNLRAGDMLARLGGDEFVVILQDLKSAMEAELVFQRIIGAVRRLAENQERLRQVGLSIGVAVCATNTGDTDSLLVHADTAMYEAKRRGGNAVVFAEPLAWAVEAD